MSPEIITFPTTFPDDKRVFGLTLYKGEPLVIGHGFFFHHFCSVIMILGLRGKMIERYPERAEEIDRERQRAVNSLCRIGMPLEMAEEFIAAVIDKIPGVVVRCQTRPLQLSELPEGVRLGEHTGVEGSFELVMPKADQIPLKIV